MYPSQPVRSSLGRGQLARGMALVSPVDTHGAQEAV
jgi:hypothetical protein